MNCHYLYKAVWALIAMGALGVSSASAQGGATGGTTGGATGGGTGGGLTGGAGLGGTGGTGDTGGNLATSGLQLQGSGLEAGQTLDTGAGTSMVGQSMFLGGYYASPFALGYTSGQGASSSSGFGNPIFNATQFTGSRATVGTSTVGTTGVSGVGVGSAAIPFASSAGTRRALPYTTRLGFEYQRRPVVNYVPQLQNVFANTSRLSAGSNVNVTVQGNTVHLNGTVATARERRLAEAMIRLSPGVRRVQNNLTHRERP